MSPRRERDMEPPAFARRPLLEYRPDPPPTKRAIAPPALYYAAERWLDEATFSIHATDEEYCFMTNVANTLRPPFVRHPMLGPERPSTFFPRPHEEPRTGLAVVRRHLRGQNA